MNLLTVKNLYVRIEGKVIVENLNYRLKELEARLDPALFVRLARGTLANIEMIARVSPMPGGTFVVTRKNNQQLQASRLQSRRSLDIALKYSASGNSDQVQAAAITILAAVGKNDPRVFPIISEALRKGVAFQRCIVRRIRKGVGRTGRSAWRGSFRAGQPEAHFSKGETTSATAGRTAQTESSSGGAQNSR
jgi:hypothetical protein